MKKLKDSILVCQIFVGIRKEIYTIFETHICQILNSTQFKYPPSQTLIIFQSLFYWVIHLLKQSNIYKTPSSIDKEAL